MAVLCCFGPAGGGPTGYPRGRLNPLRSAPAAIAAVLLFGCDGYGLIVLPSAGVSTVANATWNPPPTGRSRLVIADRGGPQLYGAWQEGGQTIETPVLGMQPDHAYVLYVEAEEGEPGAEVAYTTRSVSTSLPAWTVEGSAGWEGFAVTTLLGDDNWVVVLDETGSPIWHYDIPEDGQAMRARLRRAGDGIWYSNSVLSEDTNLPELVAIDWNGKEIDRISVEQFSHDWVELADGTLAALLFEPENIDDEKVVGNRITEINPATGAQTQVWSAFDTWTPGLHGDTTSDGGWLGGNALDLSADETTYTAGFRAVDSILEIDRASGTVLRDIGGPTSTYSFPDDPSSHRQHQFEWVGDNLLVFDNRESADFSRVVEYAFDESAKTATAVWTYQHNPPVWAFSLGDVDRNEEGSTLVTWSSAGIIDEVSLAGDLRWTMSTEFGTAIGFLTRETSIGGYSRQPD